MTPHDCRSRQQQSSFIPAPIRERYLSQLLRMVVGHTTQWCAVTDLLPREYGAYAPFDISQATPGLSWYEGMFITEHVV
jgi:hypothetical protein